MMKINKVFAIGLLLFVIALLLTVSGCGRSVHGQEQDTGRRRLNE